MSLESVNRICPNCKNPNYMVFLGDFSKAYKYKCMNCNRYFNDIDFEKEPLQSVWKSKWIRAKDRLPNDGQDVLAYLYNGEETRIAPFNYDKGTWYDCVMNCTVAINSITHWMPLPEPPKEVSE